MTKKVWAYLSAILSLFGSGLLYYSFQASGAPFVLVNNDAGGVALCVGDTAMFVSEHSGEVSVSPVSGCPKWPHGTPAAVVNTEHPKLGKIGFWFVVVGFFAQLLSIEGPAKQLTKSQARRLREDSN
ncbi:MAG: hypothetical protein ACHP8B_18085 [Terriglobales bacterium]